MIDLLCVDEESLAGFAACVDFQRGNWRAAAAG
jgi:hypothetical protein